MSAQAHTESPRMMAERHPAAGGRPGNVLVVGGYGEVGRNVARRLASFLPGRVVVAGRNLGRAQAFAEELGRGASARAVDTGAAAPALDLSNLSTVVMCVDQADTGLVERCLLERVDYVDVTAHQPSIDAIERLDHLACARQSTAVLSVGLCPGVTNLLAAHAARAFDTLSKIDIFLMIGSGDRHGEAAIDWTLANLSRPFTVFRDDRRRTVRGMAEHELVTFPGDRRPRRAYRFNFPDQRTIVRTLRVRTASTWLCFDSALLTLFTRAIAPLTSGDSGFNRIVRHLLARAMRAVRFGSDACQVLVRAEGRVSRETVVREFAVSSRGEAHVTGLIAAETVRMLMEGGRRGGVFHLEQLADARRMLTQLRDAIAGTTLRL